MGTEIPPSSVDRLVLLATVSAIGESLPRKRRLKLVARLLAIARDWELPDNVIELRGPRPEAMRQAAGRLRSAAEILRPDERHGG